MRRTYEEAINALIPRAEKIANGKVAILREKCKVLPICYEREQLQDRIDKRWNQVFHEEMDFLAYYKIGRRMSWFDAPFLAGRGGGPRKEGNGTRKLLL